MKVRIASPEYDLKTVGEVARVLRDLPPDMSIKIIAGNPGDPYLWIQPLPGEEK